MKKQGYEVVDYGTYTEDSCDYPDYASKAAKAVASENVERCRCLWNRHRCINYM